MMNATRILGKPGSCLLMRTALYGYNRCALTTMASTRFSIHFTWEMSSMQQQQHRVQWYTTAAKRTKATNAIRNADIGYDDSKSDAPHNEDNEEMKKRKRSKRRFRKATGLLLILGAFFGGVYAFVAYWDKRIERKRIALQKMWLESPLIPLSPKKMAKFDEDSPLKYLASFFEDCIQIIAKGLIYCIVSDDCPSFIKKYSEIAIDKLLMMDLTSQVVLDEEYNEELFQYISKSIKNPEHSHVLFHVIASLSLCERGTEVLSSPKWFRLLCTTLQEEKSLNNATVGLFTLFNILQHEPTEKTNEEIGMITKTLFNTSNRLSLDHYSQKYATSSMLLLAENGFTDALIESGLCTTIHSIILQQVKQPVVPILRNVTKIVKLLSETKKGRKILLAEQWVKALSCLSLSTDFTVKIQIAEIISNLLETNVGDVNQGIETLLHHTKEIQSEPLQEQFVLRE